MGGAHRYVSCHFSLTLIRRAGPGCYIRAVERPLIGLGVLSAKHSVEGFLSGAR
jgi:hypothetical protein